MIKITRSLLVAAVFSTMVLIFSLFLGSSSVVVDAQTTAACESSAICENAGTQASLPGGQAGRCQMSWLLNNRNNLQGISDIYFECVDNGNACCKDPCAKQNTANDCLKLTESAGSTSPLCIFMPSNTNLYSCISKIKLCALNNYATCSRLALCEFDNVTQQCGLKTSYTAAEQQDFSLAGCPALHGAVVAFLALMFVSLVGAIIFVVVVVIVKQRKADQEEKEAAEQAAAAEAAAKAQQEEQADF